MNRLTYFLLLMFLWILINVQYVAPSLKIFRQILVFYFIPFILFFKSKYNRINFSEN